MPFGQGGVRNQPHSAFFMNDLKQAIAIIRRGGILIYPTETLYGLGCDATNEAALRRLFEVKGRALTQPPPVLIAGVAQLEMLVAEVPVTARELMEKHWPGALTLVLPAQNGLCPLLTAQSNGVKTIGVRESGHIIARALCEGAGVPIVATSANFSGATGNAAAPRTLDDIPAEFKALVDLVLDDGAVGGAPSTIVDCTGEAPRVLRRGAVELDF